MAKVSPTKLFFVGGFRSNEVSEDHYLAAQLREDGDHRTETRTLIEIFGLKLEDVACFISDTLNREETEVIPLAKLVFEMTNGNSFSVRQYIDFLYRNGHIYYSLQKFRWEWEDLGTIQGNSLIESNIGEIVQKKILQTMVSVK